MTEPEPAFGVPPRQRLEAELCLPFAEALKTVPHLKTRLAAREFLDLQLAIQDIIDGAETPTFVRYSAEVTAKLAAMGLEEEDLVGTTVGSAFMADRLTPKGAGLFVRFIREGLMPFSRKVDPTTVDLSALEAYASREDELLDASRMLREERQAKQDARDAAWKAMNDRARHLALHPEEARPEELTARLIDAVFYNSPAFGPGRTGSMVLGGLTCHKDRDTWVSNSGKSRKTTWTVWWIDADGVRRGDPEPVRLLNRRSDPDRNWGLGRD
ncbi:hypothetical protein LAZ40_09615 [Cereibacter sphaeroides]|uniref:hypothetical protein n=1 Tax=Cereibacter sphaeroides TaxID=1063 RepID=UPI001F2DD28F|nr:hypothetical protein [Cereibacter sphaeroides]MCE6959307.1 hypothetical protein [Cereibacter sphaeroides]MCE6972899.1 hypothetical protein [Cereibacter sphaeroides]